MTFAGSPDRVEAQLVPEAGFELDTFRISGLPRRPSVAARPRAAARRRGAARVPARSCARGAPTSCSAAAATSRARWSSPPRRCASRRRSPRRTRTSGSRTGSRRRSRGGSSSRTRSRRATGAKVRVVGRPIPARSAAVPQAEAREIFELPADGPDPRRLRRARRCAGAERVRRRDVGRRRARRSCTSPAGATSSSSARARAAATTTASSPRPIGSAPRSRPSISCSARPGSTVWEIAAAGRPAIFVPYPFATGDHQAANAEHFVRAGGAIMVRELELDRRARPRALAARRRRPARADGRGDARRRASPTRPTRSPTSSSRWRADEGPPAVVRRDRRRRASARTRSSRGRGARGRRLGPRRTPYLEPLDGVERRDLARARRSRRLGGGRLVAPTRSVPGPAPRRVPARARRPRARRSSSPARTARGRPRR